jgi:hypothetical protein
MKLQEIQTLEELIAFTVSYESESGYRKDSNQPYIYQNGVCYMLPTKHTHFPLDRAPEVAEVDPAGIEKLLRRSWTRVNFPEVTGSDESAIWTVTKRFNWRYTRHDT